MSCSAPFTMCPSGAQTHASGMCLACVWHASPSPQARQGVVVLASRDNCPLSQGGLSSSLADNHLFAAPARLRGHPCAFLRIRARFPCAAHARRLRSLIPFFDSVRSRKSRDWGAKTSSLAELILTVCNTIPFHILFTLLSAHVFPFTRVSLPFHNESACCSQLFNDSGLEFGCSACE
jgi:hypothetical protein